jgi:TolA-binding protein
MKSKLFHITGLSFIIFLFFVAAVSIVQIGNAQEARPAIVDDAEADLRNNQKRIAELRPYVEEFEALKVDNIKQITRLEDNGYRFLWEKNLAEKIPAGELPKA